MTTETNVNETWPQARRPELGQGHDARGGTALVLGATGGIGGHVARGLVARGWTVRALSRRVSEVASRQPEFTWVQGDAMEAGDVARAAQGVDVVVHAVNPPGYRDWEKLVLPMLENSIAAARENSALVVLPGTVYNYGPDAFPSISEDSPQNPRTRKGAIRVEMEKRLERAAADGVASLIVRAGDFFGPRAGNSWFSQGLVKPGRPATAIAVPNIRGVGHQWAYLPDVAETMIRLIERRESLPTFARFHMKGFWDHDGLEMAQAIRRAVGRPLKIRHFPWWMLPIAAPFVPVFRELREMRYLWEEPVQMGNDWLVAVLGEEPSTPIDDAVRATLADLRVI